MTKSTSKDEITLDLPMFDLGNEEFVPVALISLEDCGDRRRELRRRGIPEEWTHKYFPAVDFRKVKSSDAQNYTDEKYTFEIYKKFLRPPEIGCALSHQKAYKWFAQSNFDLMLVLEDDINPTHVDYMLDLVELARMFRVHASDEKAFFCSLGQRLRPAMRKVISRSPDKPSFQNTGAFLHCDTDFDLWKAHAYLISRTAAKRMSEGDGKVRLLADDWSRFTALGFFDQQFLCFPQLFDQDDEGKSTVQVNSGETEVNFKPYFLNRVRSAIREGSFLSRACRSISYRINAKLSHCRALFPYKID